MLTALCGAYAYHIISAGNCRKCWSHHALLRLFWGWSHLIEPCGFPLGDKRMRRAAMDYAVPGGIQSALDWETYRSSAKGRQVLMTTKGAVPLQDFAFETDDTLIFGAEGSGVPEFVHANSDARVVIPMVEGARSLNLSNSVALTLFEALRQTNGLP